ncbi:MAG: phosphate acyltransferase PlsX [Betaproteobacteria bacterium]|nr:phosphate acyltransferase PlsX [Betaproteobacteria bacterium]
MARLIAFDVMSGDLGIEAAIAAIKIALAENPQMQIIAVGDEKRLQAQLAGHDRVQIRHAEAVVSMAENPKQAVRRRNTSLYKTIELVADGHANVAVSAGNTGALMITAKVLLKMRPPYRRPAIAGQIPCVGCTDSFTMLDLGANVDRSPEMLVDFARMGSEFARVVKGSDSPRIALLNVGTENIKGGQDLLAAHQLLGETDLNYTGFIEANSLFDPATAAADLPQVVVCDGFVGNVFLKTIEGLSKMIKSMFGNAYQSTAYSRLAGLVSLPVLNGLRKTMDSRRYNGASFLGLRGLVVKAHGNSDSVGLACALAFAMRQIDDQQSLIG